MKKRAKGTVTVPGFPISIRVKPTRHHQYCFLCRQEIERGEQEFIVPSGMWTTWLPRDKGERKAKINENGMGFTSISIDGFHRFGGSGGGSDYQIIIGRKLYFHTDCYTCLFKRMVAKAHLPFTIDAGCNECQNRFNCYAGNINLSNVSSFGYSPARPSEIMPPPGPRTKFVSDNDLDIAIKG